MNKDSYIAFDALSLRQLIIDRLNEQQVFTDQNYIGSNLASIIDIVSFAYSSLIYYLNKTSTETLFSEAQLYENINRIVKLLDYKPVGIQTATISPQISGTANLAVGNYTIPRYSYIFANNIQYSFNNDISFAKTETGLQYLADVSRKQLLYQGTYIEHPAMVALGEDNETFTVTTNNLVDYFNIDVYVKSTTTGKYHQYIRTSNLYYENAAANVYEVRLNENKQIEVKFGNNINGSKLLPGDTVQIYYLASTGSAGEIGAYALANAPISIYNTPTFNSILSDIQKYKVNIINQNYGNRIIITNDQSSTPFSYEESVDQIRTNAPKTFRSSNRLVTLQDFETFIQARFGYLLTDIKAYNNWNYLSQYLKYYYDIGLTKPDLITRPQFNQIYFADSCNFNNIYLIGVPRAQSTTVNYLSPSLKQLIIDSVQDKKVATSEIVFIDPVYKAFTFGIPDANNNVDISNELLNQLVIVRDTTASIEDSYIKTNVIAAITNFFSHSNNLLGKLVDLNALLSAITSVDGVKRVYIRRQDTGQIFDGISFFVWNPEYSEQDRSVVYNSYKLQDFEYPYFFNIENIQNKVVVETSNINYQTLEY